LAEPIRNWRSQSRVGWATINTSIIVYNALRSGNSSRRKQMKNDRMNTSESVESAGEEMAEEAKHSNETEGNTEAGAADRQKEQLDIPRDLSYKQIFLSKGNNTLGYKYPLYTRCEFREDFHSITYFDGTVVERPARLTVLRTGQEVFLCPAQRSKAIAKIFVFVGAMATNVKMPHLCLAVLLDKAAYEFHKGINDF